MQHAHARLGETKREVDARYGGGVKKQSEPGEEMFAYAHGDFFILVTLVYGKSAMELYGHRDGKTPLSPKEIESFLNLNSSGQHWRRSPNNPLWSLGGVDQNTWTAMAAYYPKSPQMAGPALGVLMISYAKKHGWKP